jgi:cysteine synthase A
MQIHDNILSTLGDTPLVALRRFHPEGCLLAAKIESFNPCGSSKDRIGIEMIETAEREAASQQHDRRADLSNTGLGLAMAATSRTTR